MDKSAGRGVLKSPLSSFDRCCQNLGQAFSVQGLKYVVTVQSIINFPILKTQTIGGCFKVVLGHNNFLPFSNLPSSGMAL